MKEYVLRLLKVPEGNSDRGKEFPITWAHYDRISWERLEDRINSFFTWDGEIQEYHIYDLRMPEAYSGDDVIIKDGCLQLAGQSYPYFGVSILSLSNEVKEELFFGGRTTEESIKSHDYGIRLRRIVKSMNDMLIESFPDENRPFISWFGSLGEEDVLLLLASDSLERITNTIEKLRCVTFIANSNNNKKKAVDYVYSFILPNSEEIKKLMQTMPSNTPLSLSVSLTFGGDMETEVSYIDKVSELGTDLVSGVTRCQGKYDLQFGLNIKTDVEYDKCFGEDGILNSKEHSCILNRKIIVNYKTNNEPTYIRIPDEYCKRMDIKTEEGSIEGVLDITEKLMKEAKDWQIFKHVPELYPALASLFNDYYKCRSSVFTQYWSSDLKLQIGAFLANLQQERILVTDQLKIFEEIIKDFQQVTMHINQSSRLLMDLPTSNLRYNGVYNKALRACYGMVKSALMIGYHQIRGENYTQDSIIPIITFKHIPNIHSQLMFDEVARVDIDRSDRKDYEDRNAPQSKFVDIHIPYAALQSIHSYIPYILHEVFHYICPADRATRNEAAYCAWLKRYCDIQIRNVLTYMRNKGSAGLENRERIIDSFIRAIEEVIIQKINDKLERARINGSVYYNLNTFYHGFLQDIEKYRDMVIDILGDDKVINGTEEICKKVGEENKDEVRRIIEELKEYACGGKQSVLRDHITNENSEDGNISVAEVMYSMFDGIQEASADIFMCSILGFCEGKTDEEKNANLYHYLKILAHKFYEECVELVAYFGLDGNQTNKESLNLQAILRFGMVIDFIICNETFLPVKESRNRVKRLKEYLDRMEKEGNEEDRYCRFFADYIVETVYFRYTQLFCWERSDLLLIANSLFKPVEKDSNEGYDSIYVHIKAFRHFYMAKKPDAYLNIRAIEHYQYQLPLEQVFLKYRGSIEEKARKYRPISASPGKGETRPSLLEKRVWSFDEYIRELPSCVKQLTTECSDAYMDPVWYRGVSTAAHELTPSLFRSISKDSVAPMEYIAEESDMFGARSVHVAELSAYKDVSRVNQLANMQHYEMSSPFLDWSENGITALYFAVVPFKRLGQASRGTGERDAAVYLLNPLRMNKAKNRMERWYRNYLKISKKDDPNAIYGKQQGDAAYPLINLCNPLQAERYWQYLPPEDIKYFNKGIKKWEANKEERNSSRDGGVPMSYIDMLWPIAIMGSEVNPRIAAQKGMFTAVNLTSCMREAVCKDEKEKNKMFDYLSITHMQLQYKRYIRYFINGRVDGAKELLKNEDFLFKITIKRDNLKEVEMQLKQIGVTDMHVYPDLARIGDAVERQIKGYRNHEEIEKG